MLNHQKYSHDGHYDRWKLESPEDENERLNGPARRRMARQEYLADHVDYVYDRERQEEHDEGK